MLHTDALGLPVAPSAAWSMTEDAVKNPHNMPERSKVAKSSKVPCYRAVKVDYAHRKPFQRLKLDINHHSE